MAESVVRGLRSGCARCGKTERALWGFCSTCFWKLDVTAYPGPASRDLIYGYEYEGEYTDETAKNCTLCKTEGQVATKCKYSNRDLAVRFDAANIGEAIQDIEPDAIADPALRKLWVAAKTAIDEINATLEPLVAVY